MAKGPTHLDRTLEWLKNRPAVAWIVIVSILVIGIGNIAASIQSVRDLWQGQEEPQTSIASDCKYILVHPLFDKLPDSITEVVGLQLSSSTADVFGRVNTLFEPEQATRRRVVALKGMDESVYKMRFAYNLLDDTAPPWTDPLGRVHPGLKLMQFEYEFRIGHETYYEFVKDDQTKAGFRINAIPEAEASRTITRSRFTIPDCRYAPDGVSW